MSTLKCNLAFSSIGDSIQFYICIHIHIQVHIHSKQHVVIHFCCSLHTISSMVIFTVYFYVYTIGYVSSAIEPVSLYCLFVSLVCQKASSSRKWNKHCQPRWQSCCLSYFQIVVF